MTIASGSRSGWQLAAVLLLAALPSLSPAAEQHSLVDVPYVPMPEAVVDAMLKLASIGPRDFVVDLGSGDGRIIIAAAKKHGARGFGVEIDAALVNEARREAKRQGVAGRVEFLEQNLFITEIDRASVLTLYLYPRLLMQLRPRFFKELRPGTRIVSHDFDMEDWQPDARVTVPVPGKPYGPPSSEVYFWVVPANAAGNWRWRSPAAGSADVEVALSQTFQKVEGTPQVGGRRARLEQGGMRGDEIRFILTVEVDGQPLRHEYSGRLSSDSISGKVKLAGGEFDWNATRTRRGSIDIKSDQ